MTEYIIAIITAITSFIVAYVASSLTMKNIKLPYVEKFSA